MSLPLLVSSVLWSATILKTNKLCRSFSRPRPLTVVSATARGSARPPPRAKQQSSDLQRLSKVLAGAGVASRRTAEELIFEGRVSVNNKTELLPQTHVSPVKDKITVDGKSIAAQQQAKLYFALNKPKGYICSSTPSAEAQQTPRLAVDLLSDVVRDLHKKNTRSNALPPRLFTVGRLDVQSTGLILVTNDGKWANEVSHPSGGVTKEYVVTTSDYPNKQQLKGIADGCLVDGTEVKPIAVQLETSDPHLRNKLRIVLAEGKNREVRELISHVGLDVRYLKRVRVGGYRLPKDLGIGQFRELKPHEVRRVTDKAAQADPYL